MRRTAWIGLALAGLLVSLGMTLGAASAASHYIKMTMTASPNPAAGTTVVTFTGTVTPVGGPFYGVQVEMSPINGGGCTFRCEWSVPTLSSKMTFRALAFSEEKPVTITVTACQPDTCLVQPASVFVAGPTDSMSLTYSPAGVISPGEHLHFIVRGTTNVGPVSANLQTSFVSGLAAPTNLSSGATWSGPPYSEVEEAATLDRTGSYSFDATVTARLGGSVKLVLTPYNDAAAQATAIARTVVLHVGPVATPTPRRTQVATQSPRPTSEPSPPPAIGSPSLGSPGAPISSLLPTAGGPVTVLSSPTGGPGDQPSGSASQSGGNLALTGSSPMAQASAGAPTSIDSVSVASSVLVSGALGFIAVLIVGGVGLLGLSRRRH